MEAANCHIRFPGKRARTNRKNHRFRKHLKCLNLENNNSMYSTATQVIRVLMSDDRRPHAVQRARGADSEHVHGTDGLTYLLGIGTGNNTLGTCRRRVGQRSSTGQCRFCIDATENKH